MLRRTLLLFALSASCLAPTHAAPSAAPPIALPMFPLPIPLPWLDRGDDEDAAPEPERTFGSTQLPYKRFATLAELIRAVALKRALDQLEAAPDPELALDAVEAKLAGHPLGFTAELASLRAGLDRGELCAAIHAIAVEIGRDVQQVTTVVVQSFANSVPDENGHSRAAPVWNPQPVAPVECTPPAPPRR